MEDNMIDLGNYGVHPEDLEPGVYVAASGTPGYRSLNILESYGHAIREGEKYAEDGTLVIVDRVLNEQEMQNPVARVRLSREYFRQALNEYSRWKEVWWREAIQNAVDAGATEIACESLPVEWPDQILDRERDETNASMWRITCVDNGHGMDGEVLRAKFLDPGGTMKKAGDVGGFGRAKELLIRPWPRWEVRSRDTIAWGTFDSWLNLEYEWDKTEFVQGTRLTVWMLADEYTPPTAAATYIAKCNLPRVRLTVNGHVVKANFSSGKRKRDVGGMATVYRSSRSPKSKFQGIEIEAPSSLMVRAKSHRGSLYMFPAAQLSGVSGTIVIEVTAKPKEAFTANRDGFTYTLGQRVQKLIEQLSTDVRSALREREHYSRTFFRDEAGRDMDMDAAFWEELSQPDPGKTMTRGDLDKVVEIVEHFRDPHLVGMGKSALTIAPGTARAIASLPVRGAHHWDGLLALMAYRPRFLLLGDPESTTKPKKKYVPGTMTLSYHCIWRYWAEIIRLVMAQIPGSYREYGVGFTLAPDVNGLYRPAGDYLCVNPHHDLANRKARRLTNRDDREAMYATAIHEVTHMTSGAMYHNEDYASAITLNMRHCFRGFRFLDAIRKDVVALVRQEREALVAEEPQIVAASASMGPVDETEAYFVRLLNEILGVQPVREHGEYTWVTQLNRKVSLVCVYRHERIPELHSPYSIYFLLLGVKVPWRYGEGYGAFLNRIEDIVYWFREGKLPKELADKFARVERMLLK